MQIIVQKKSLGRSRKLMATAYELPNKPSTLRELLQELVAIEVENYSKSHTLLNFLTADVEADLAERGQVRFSSMTSHTQQSVAKGIRTMELAFEDGLFKVMQGQYVYLSLDDAIHSDEASWTFIKLVFLAGR